MSTLKTANTLYTFKEKANEHLKAKRYTNAIVYYMDILKQFDEVIQEAESEQQMESLIKELKISSHKNISLCYLKTGNNAKCIEQCQIVLDIEPNNIKILYRIGKALIHQGRHYQAENYLKRAFAIDPNQEEVLKALEQVEIAHNKGKQIEEPKSSKSLFQLCVYFPLLILNFLLSLIFGQQQKSNGKQEEKDRKTN